MSSSSPDKAQILAQISALEARILHYVGRVVLCGGEGGGGGGGGGVLWWVWVGALLPLQPLTVLCVYRPS